METDDDIRYMIIALLMLEEKGLDWSRYELGKLWHRKLPYNSVCTAETQAYLNFSQVTSHCNAVAPMDAATEVNASQETNLTKKLD
jgi:hypothetical protein